MSTQSSDNPPPVPPRLDPSPDQTRQRRRWTDRGEQDERLRLAAQMGKVGIWEWNIPDNRVTWSESHYAIHGVAHDQFDQTVEGFAALVHPDDRAEVAEAIQRTLTGGVPYEVEFRSIRPDGETIWLYANAVLIQEHGRPTRMLGATMDITQRKRTEEANARLAAIVDSSDDAIVAKTLDGIITSWNRSAERMFGYTEAEAVGRHISLIVPDDRRREQKDVLERLRNGEAIQHFETVRRTKDGRLLTISLTVSPIKDSRGRTIGASKIARDITERKRTETKLREAQERLHAVVNNAPITLFAFDQAGTVTFAAGQRLFPAAEDSVSAMIDRPIRDIFRDAAWMLADIERASSGSAFTNVGELAGRWTEVHWTPLRDDGGAIVGAIGVASDVTEKKRTEQEIIKVSKLESLGILAGGIAHDFNNILTAIVGNLALAKMYLKPDDKALTRVVESEKAALRAQTLTYQLLTFSKGGQPIKRTIALGEFLHESAEFPLQGSNVRCDVSVPEDLWLIEADEEQINQVIVNLVLNAQQAMPAGGGVRIVAKNVTVAEGDGLPVPPGDFVRITVRDQGVGIRRDDIEKIFDPFFTTKPKGSGLGLTSAYWIIKRHGGHMVAESTMGSGSTIVFYLPRSSADRPAGLAPDTVTVRGKGRILFMDDEAPIRDFTSELLAQLGYEVVVCADGHEAIERFEKARLEGRPFDAVILDLTVRTGMGGQEAIAHLRRLDPQVKAIVSSGYSTDPVMADFSSYGFAARAAKPYRAKDFSAVLAEVLQTKPSS